MTRIFSPEVRYQGHAIILIRKISTIEHTNILLIYRFCLVIMAHCGWWTLTVLIAVTLMSSFHVVTGITLNIPSQIDIGGQNSGNNQMTVSCSHTGGTVYVMEIGKLNQNNNKEAIVKVQPPNLDTVSVEDTSLQQRMSQISGSTSSGSLQFTLSDLVCTDAGRYYCSVTFSGAGATDTDEDLKNVTARTYPGVINMVVTPNNLQYNVGDLIEFNCNGQIGNQFNKNNLAGFWQWEWGSIDQSWTSYPNPNNITYGTPTVAANCQYNGRSRLFHTVTAFDNGRRFRCYVLNNAVNASEKTVYTQVPPVTDRPVTDRPCNGHDDDSSSSSLGVGIVIGMGVMFLCGGLCLIIAFIYRRRVAAAGQTNRTSGIIDLHRTQAPTTAETELNQTAGGEYEMPGNFYDGLQERNVDIPSPYDTLKTYQNT